MPPLSRRLPPSDDPRELRDERDDLEDPVDLDDMEALDDDLDLELLEPRLRDSEFDLEVDDPDEVLFDEPADLLR